MNKLPECVIDIIVQYAQEYGQSPKLQPWLRDRLESGKISHPGVYILLNPNIHAIPLMDEYISKISELNAMKSVVLNRNNFIYDSITYKHLDKFNKEKFDMMRKNNLKHDIPYKFTTYPLTPPVNESYQSKYPNENVRFSEIFRNSYSKLPIYKPENLYIDKLELCRDPRAMELIKTIPDELSYDKLWRNPMIFDSNYKKIKKILLNI